jgi:GTP cyclohydrolase I
MSSPPRAAPNPEAAAGHLAAALAALGLGEDPEMATTPARVAQFLGEFAPGPVPACEPLPTRGHAPVVVRDLAFASLCAHHLLPFFGHMTIAYRPDGKIAGLGWFPRVVEALARRPQLQERLVEEVADAVVAALSPKALIVWCSARQMCVEMRGPRAHATFEVSARRGLDDRDLLALVSQRAR